MKIVISGASGFIGRALIPYLLTAGHEVKAWPRHYDLNQSSSHIPPREWIEQLEGVDAVIHLAGLAHQRNLQNPEPYFRINRDGTLLLAAAAQRAGVKRFIFLSSAKVFGEGGDTIYRAASVPAPQDAYAQSKWQAEQRLREQNASAHMELVILRPPLVYALEAKANFAQLVSLARLPIPLPFAGIENQRALIGLDNLIDLISICLTNPSAPGKTLLCADAHHYSLPDLLTNIRRALDRAPNLFRIPKPALSTLAIMLGASKSERLFGSFQLDCRATHAALNWTPPLTMEQVLRGRRNSTA